MQLVFAIVQNEDADQLTGYLNKAGFELTRLRTRGGFLGRGNVTLFAGVADDRVPAMLDIIRATCHTRKRYINPTPTGVEPTHLSMAAPSLPLEVIVGGATVFTFPVRRFERLPALSASTAGDSSRTELQAEAIYMLLAIVHNEDADQVIRALLGANFRVTRLSTAGGFLRRGNVTLLAGIEGARIDDVLRIIEANCRQAAGASPPGNRPLAHAATVFILEASQFLHL